MWWAWWFGCPAPEAPDGGAPPPSDSGAWVVDTGSAPDPASDPGTACDADGDGAVDEGRVVVRQPSGAVLPFDDLRAAVAVAADGATVLVCPGVHRANVTLLRDLTVVAPAGGSGGAPSVVVPSGDGPVIAASAGRTVRLVGLHLRGCAEGPAGPPDSGSEPDDSGAPPDDDACAARSTGVHVESAASVTLTNVRLSHHPDGGLRAERGAAVALVGGRVDHNAAEEGGGLYLATGAVAAGTVVAHNVATRGGGWYVDAGEVVGSDVIVSGNVADAGGGLFVRDGDVTLDRSTLVDNAALAGGGAYLWGRNTLVGDELVVLQNRADDGGGLYVDAPGEAVDVGARVIDNLAGAGGGAYLGGGTLTATTFTRNRSVSGRGGAAFVAPGAALEVLAGDLGGAGPDDNDPPDVFPSSAGVNVPFGLDACFGCTSEACTPCAGDR